MAFAELPDIAGPVGTLKRVIHETAHAWDGVYNDGTWPADPRHAQPVLLETLHDAYVSQLHGAMPRCCVATFRSSRSSADFRFVVHVQFTAAADGKATTRQYLFNIMDGTATTATTATIEMWSTGGRRRMPLLTMLAAVCYGCVPEEAARLTLLSGMHSDDGAAPPQFAHRPLMAMSDTEYMSIGEPTLHAWPQRLSLRMEPNTGAFSTIFTTESAHPWEGMAANSGLFNIAGAMYGERTAAEMAPVMQAVYSELQAQEIKGAGPVFALRKSSRAGYRTLTMWTGSKFMSVRVRSTNTFFDIITGEGGSTHQHIAGLCFTMLRRTGSGSEPAFVVPGGALMLHRDVADSTGYSYEMIMFGTTRAHSGTGTARVPHRLGATRAKARAKVAPAKKKKGATAAHDEEEKKEEALAALGSTFVGNEMSTEQRRRMAAAAKTRADAQRREDAALEELVMFMGGAGGGAGAGARAARE